MANSLPESYAVGRRPGMKDGRPGDHFAGNRETHRVPLNSPPRRLSGPLRAGIRSPRRLFMVNKDSKRLGDERGRPISPLELPLKPHASLLIYRTSRRTI